MSRTVTGEKDSSSIKCACWAVGGWGVACAALTPGAPDDSSVARWTLLYAPTHTNIPMHIYLDTNTYCTHIHNYCHPASKHILYHLNMCMGKYKGDVHVTKQDTKNHEQS